MRKLMWLTLGFAAGCGYCAYISGERLWIGLCVLGVLGLVLGGYSRRLTPAELCCLGAALGLCWFGQFQARVLAPAMALDGREEALCITVSDYSWDSDYGITCDGTLELEDRQYRVRFYVNEKRYLTPGDRVTGVFRLRYTPGGQEDATFHAGSGMYLLAYPRGTVTVEQGRSGRMYAGAELAHWLKVRLRLLLPADVQPFAQALLLGDSTELDYETENALKISGIRHIVAVSGLHVMLLYGLIRSLMLRNKWLTALAAAPVLVLFCAAAGFTPSVTRASIMAALMLGAELAEQEYDPLTALAFSALVMLLWNPLVISSVGFQLTVLCVAGIQVLGEPLKGWMKRKRIPDGTAASASMSLGAMGLTTPLCAGYFGSVSLVAPVTNLLTVWLVNGIFSGLVVTVLLSLVKLRWAAWLGGLLAWPIRLVLWIAGTLSGLPLAAVYTASPYIVLWLCFLYLLVWVGLNQFRKRTGLLACCAALGLAVSLACSWAEPGMDACRLTMLDVGQGQCILLQSRGENYLIDCGGSYADDAADAAAEILLSQGIRCLDGIILTHWDEDHAGGVPLLLTRVDADVLYAPEGDGETLSVTEETAIPMGAGMLRIFPGNYGEESNENSLCVLFESENCAILITGDRSSLGELLLLAEYDIPDCDLLIAGHHGSKYSTSDALLEAVRPEYVFISAGEDNPYGHPAPELLQRLEAHGCRVYGTYESGTIIFRR